MPDFNKVLEPGDYQNGEVNTVIEIPMGSTNKIEWDRQRAAFMRCPCGAGFADALSRFGSRQARPGRSRE